MLEESRSSRMLRNADPFERVFPPHHGDVAELCRKASGGLASTMLVNKTWRTAMRLPWADGWATVADAA